MSCTSSGAILSTLSGKSSGALQPVPTRDLPTGWAELRQFAVVHPCSDIAFPLHLNRHRAALIHGWIILNSVGFSHLLSKFGLGCSAVRIGSMYGHWAQISACRQHQHSNMQLALTPADVMGSGGTASLDTRRGEFPHHSMADMCTDGTPSVCVQMGLPQRPFCRSTHMCTHRRGGAQHAAMHALLRILTRKDSCGIGVLPHHTHGMWHRCPATTRMGCV